MLDNPSAWLDAGAVLGPEDGAAVVAAILQRSRVLKSPAGYLRSLTEKARAARPARSSWPKARLADACSLYFFATGSIFERRMTNVANGEHMSLDRAVSSINQAQASTNARLQAVSESRNDDRRHRTHASNSERSVHPRKASPARFCTDAAKMSHRIGPAVRPYGLERRGSRRAAACSGAQKARCSAYLFGRARVEAGQGGAASGGPPARKFKRRPVRR